MINRVQPMSGTFRTVWVVSQDPLSRSQYYRRSINPPAIEVIEICGDESAEQRRAIAAEVGSAANRLYSLEECSGSSLIRDLIIGFPGTVFVHDHLFVDTPVGGDHYLRPELEAANKLVFFNERALLDIARDLPSAAGSSRLYLTGMPAAACADTEVRNSILFTGDPRRIEQRAEKLLGALCRLAAPPALVWLVGSGEEARARELVEESGLCSPVEFDSRSPERFSELAPAASAAALFCAGAFGDLSPYLELSFAAGTPAIVTDMGAGCTVPAELAFKVLPGFGETQEIAAAIGRLTGGRLKLQLASELKAYAAERYSPQAAACDFNAIVCDGPAA